MGFRLDYRKDSGSWGPVPVGAPAAASVTFGAAGTGAGGTTSCAPSYPSGISASTSVLYCFITGRSNTADTAPTMPAGWTSVGSLEGGTGTWGVDTGTRRVHVFKKDTVDGTETGTVTVSLSGTTANTLRASIVRFEVPAGHTISHEFASGADTSNGTGYSATSSANMDFQANDLLAIVTAQNIDTGTATSRAVSCTDVTFGTLTNRADTAVTNGNDHRHIINTVPVSSVTGSPDNAVTFSYTISANGSGPTGFLRLRSVPDTRDVYVQTSGNITAGGEATTEQLNAPSGMTTSNFATGRMWADENGTDTVTVNSGQYTELEWCLYFTSGVTGTFDFRVTDSGAPLETYTLTPSVTLSAGATGTLAATLAAATVAASGTVTDNGTLSVTLAAATLAASGSVGGAVTGTLAQTLAAATVTASGAATVSGSLAQTLAAATSAVTGVVTIGGSLAQTLAAATSAVTGEVKVSGSLAQTLAAAGVAASGAVTDRGTLAVTLDAATSSASGIVGNGVAGTLSVTLAAATLAASGAVQDLVTGTVSATLDAAIASVSGTVRVSGTAAATLGAATLAAAGSVAGAVVGSVAATLAAATVTSVGVVTVVGNVNAVAANDVLTATGWHGDGSLYGEPAAGRSLRSVPTRIGAATASRDDTRIGATPLKRAGGNIG
jgi:hypothetical protein